MKKLIILGALSALTLFAACDALPLPAAARAHSSANAKTDSAQSQLTRLSH